MGSHETSDVLAVHDDGWAEIEETMAMTELPPVPPTSDPERLLRYVLQIHPKYTEMEMMSTHLRLYATALEQDLEQARNHAHILSNELSTERQNKQFLQQYANQVVKERNEVLHTRSGKRSKTTGTGHFTWHSCCKKNGEFASDLMPSMNAFRGEKLQEVLVQLEKLKDEVRNQERLRHEQNVMLKRTQREHDSKSAADRKNIQQLEKQLAQRAILQSRMEKKLYEVESALARHDKVKFEEMTKIKKELDEANARIKALESQCERYQVHQNETETEHEDLQDRLTHVMMLKDELADQVDQLSSELSHAHDDIQALQGEIEVLQSEDVTNLKNLYEGKFKGLKDEWATREVEYKLKIDNLRQELRVNEALLLQQATSRAEQEPAPVEHSFLLSDKKSQDSFSRQRDEWLGRTTSRSGAEYVGSTLSRSQLSQSRYSDDVKGGLSSSRDEIRLYDGNEDSISSYGDQDGSFGHEVRSESSHPSLDHHDQARTALMHSVHCSSSGPSLPVTHEQYNESRDPRAFLSRSSGDNDEKQEPDDRNDEVDGDLLADMHEVLEQFKDRRIEEEKKALAAEQALATYRQEREEFKNILSPVA